MGRNLHRPFSMQQNGERKEKRMVKTCINCGIEFTCKNDPRVKYCSPKCQRKNYKLDQVFVCRYCHKEFKSRALDRSTYCSRECAFADKKANATGRKIYRKGERERVCCICGKVFMSIMPKICCSDECKKQKDNIKSYERTTARARICKWCGVEYIPIYKAKTYSYCCENHLNKAIRNSESNKLHRGGVSKAKKARIFQRDNYRCQICGKKLKMDKADTMTQKKPHPQAPTIDHIIPISIAKKMGWSKKEINAEKNLQSACFMCNVKKGNRPIGEQLRIC